MRKVINEDLSDVLNAATSSYSPSVLFEQVWKMHDNQERPLFSKRKKLIAVIGVPVIFFCGAAYSFASGPFIQFVNSLRHSTHLKGTYEFINGIPITNADFELFIADKEVVAKLNNQAIPSRDQIKKDFNKEQVLFLQAQKQNLAVSDDVAKNYADNMQKIINQNTTIQDNQGIENVREFIHQEENGLGISDDEFWNQFAPNMYKRDLSIGELKKQFYLNYKQKNPNDPNVDSSWDKYTEKLLQQADIKPSKS